MRPRGSDGTGAGSEAARVQVRLTEAASGNSRGSRPARSWVCTPPSPLAGKSPCFEDGEPGEAGPVRWWLRAARGEELLDPPVPAQGELGARMAGALEGSGEKWNPGVTERQSTAGRQAQARWFSRASPCSPCFQAPSRLRNPAVDRDPVWKGGFGVGAGLG